MPALAVGHRADVVRPAAACAAIAGLLTGPSRTARVLGASPAAVYLTAPDPTAEADAADGAAVVVALVTVDAVRLPCALVLPERADAAGLPPPGYAARAAVGEGAVVLGHTVVRVARWWRPPIPRPPRRVAVELRDRDPFGHLPATIRARAGNLGDALAADDRQGTRTAADRLLGLGPGLTPAGDDILAGLLTAAGLAPASRGALADLAGHVRRVAARRTTTLSAALLLAAADRTGCPELVGFVDAVGGYGEPEPAYARLARIGHTSGRDLAAGVLTATRLADRRASRQRRREPA